MQALDAVLAEAKRRGVDAVIWVDRLDVFRVSSIDRQARATAVQDAWSLSHQLYTAIFLIRAMDSRSLACAWTTFGARQENHSVNCNDDVSVLRDRLASWLTTACDMLVPGDEGRDADAGRQGVGLHPHRPDARARAAADPGPDIR